MPSPVSISCLHRIIVATLRAGYDTKLPFRDDNMFWYPISSLFYHYLEDFVSVVSHRRFTKTYFLEDTSRPFGWGGPSGLQKVHHDKNG